MRTRDFNALNDLLFKFLFGHKENKVWRKNGRQRH